MKVLVRSDGAFVADTRRCNHSYTRDLTKARTFATAEQAERERCIENERVVDVDDLLARP